MIHQYVKKKKKILKKASFISSYFIISLFTSPKPLLQTVTASARFKQRAAQDQWSLLWKLHNQKPTHKLGCHAAAYGAHVTVKPKLYINITVAEPDKRRGHAWGR